MSQQFENRRAKFLALRLKRKGNPAPFSPKPGLDPLFEKCPQCGRAVTKGEWYQGGNVCPGCGRHEDDGSKQFERIRRITGYLVGTMDRWNDAKTAEEAARVKHGIQ